MQITLLDNGHVGSQCRIRHCDHAILLMRLEVTYSVVLVFEMLHWTGLPFICLIGASKFLFIAHRLRQHF